jgi:hypothetical protein
MLDLVQASLGGTAGTSSLAASSLTTKLLGTQLEAQQAVISMPETTVMVDGSQVSLQSLVEASIQAEPAFGLLSSLSGADVANQYASTEKLLSLFFGTEQVSAPVLDMKV